MQRFVQQGKNVVKSNRPYNICCDRHQCAGISIESSRTAFMESMPDEDDRVFYEVALSHEESFLVTGNLKLILCKDMFYFISLQVLLTKITTPIII